MTQSALESAAAPTIELTAVSQTSDHRPGSSVRVPTSELIAYHQQPGFTRLVLAGRKVLDVKETTQQIDSLIRNAAQQTPCWNNARTS